MDIKSALESLKSLFVNGYAGAALIAGIATYIGVHKINKQTSFKLLTIKRLKQLEEIRNIVLELRKLFEISHINKIKQNQRLFYQYKKSVNDLYNKFSAITSCYGLQETIIKKELKNLIGNIEEYICKVGCKKKIMEITKQKENFFMLSDMYTWALWKYIQRLYKSDKNLTFRFDKIFAAVYLRTYQLSPNNCFFKEFELKDLVNSSRKMRLILLWYKLRYKIA